MASIPVGEATQPLNSAPLSALSGTLQGGVNTIVNSGTNILNRFFPPEKRANLQARLTEFAAEKPYLASFLLSQVALSGLPIALFVTFTVGIGVFALLAALIVAVLGAVLFTVFMAGVALLVLLPTLFITTFSAAFIWLWGVGLYYIVKWFNKEPVPGIHKPLKDSLMGSTGLGAIRTGITDQITGQKLPPADEQDSSGRPGHPATKEQEKQQPHQLQRQQNGENTPTTTTTTTNTATSKPKPLSEKKDGANTATLKKRPESPAAVSKSPARSVRASGGPGDLGAGELKKRTSGALGGIPGAQSVAAGVAG